MIDVINRGSALIVPVLLFSIILLGLIRRTQVYDCFIEGATSGVKTVFRIFPAILAIYVAIAMLKTSGVLSLVGQAVLPFTEMIGMPSDVLPLALLRPLSGGGSIALVNDILAENGPDSMTGKIATVMSGATETTFYTIALYFGAAKIKKSSYALPASIVADFFSITMSVLVCRIIFASLT